MSYIDRQHHRTQRVGWLRAAVLGANDGLVSVGALVLGVAASQSSPASVAIAGVSAWIAGALSMAAGEYVSVSSQADTEKADLDMERRALESYPKEEHKELTRIYEQRGLEPELADKVADRLMTYDALGAHARDEIGITDAASARPLQAAGASGLTFTFGVAPPLIAMWLVPGSLIIPVVLAVSLVCLAALGALAAWTGGAPIVRGTLRVFLWGALTMVATAIIGAMLGAAG